MLASSLRDSTMGRRALVQMKCMSSEAELGWQFIYGSMLLHLNKCDTVLQLGLMNQCAFCENHQGNPDFLSSC
jgi:hypothetical protein